MASSTKRGGGSDLSSAAAGVQSTQRNRRVWPAASATGTERGSLGLGQKEMSNQTARCRLYFSSCFLAFSILGRVESWAWTTGLGLERKGEKQKKGWKEEGLVPGGRSGGLGKAPWGGLRCLIPFL